MVDASYHRDYYEVHKHRIAKKKRERYRTDPDYRERLKQLSRESYRRRKIREGKKVYEFGEPTDVAHNIVIKDGMTYYSISYAAKIAEVSILTVRHWIKEGIIPEPVRDTTSRRWRWFTPTQILLLSKMKGYQRMTRKQRAATRLLLKKYWNKEVIYDPQTKRVNTEVKAPEETEIRSSDSGDLNVQDLAETN